MTSALTLRRRRRTGGAGRLAGAAVAKGMSRSDFSRLSLRLGTGEAVGLAHLIERLAGLGYERVEEVEAMGQFSARGGIVDVFPVNRTTPVRVRPAEPSASTSSGR